MRRANPSDAPGRPPLFKAEEKRQDGDDTEDFIETGISPMQSAVS